MNSESKKEGEDKPAGAPETYADFKAPEGYEFNKERMADATKTFKDLNLSQDQAQSLMDLYGKAIIEAEEAPMKLWQDKQAEWKKEVETSELGSKIDQVKATVSKALDSLGDPKLVSAYKEAMDYTGAGNNLSFIRVLYGLASKLTEGGSVPGGKASAAGQPSDTQRPRTAAQAMYPNLPSG